MEDNKYYFFRDLDHKENFENDRSYHAAGYVNAIVSMDPLPSGKEVSVTFINPFTGEKCSEWRAVKEIELFEVDKWEWDNINNEY